MLPEWLTAVLMSVVPFAIALFGLLGNGLCLLAIYLRCEHWRANQGLIIIFSLAINDAAFCLYEIFLRLAPYIISTSPPIFFGQLALGLMVLFDVVEDVHIMIMALNRFIALITPLHYASTLTARVTRRLCVGAWLASAVFAYAWIGLFRRKYYDVSSGNMRQYNETLEPALADARTALAAACGQAYWSLTFVTLVVLVVVYVPVTNKIYRLKNNPQSQVDLDVFVCLQFLLVGVVWTLCYGFYMAADAYSLSEFAAASAFVFIYAGNPVIYAVFNKTIRDAVVALFCKAAPATTDAIQQLQPLQRNNQDNSANSGGNVVVVLHK